MKQSGKYYYDKGGNLTTGSSGDAAYKVEWKFELGFDPSSFQFKAGNDEVVINDQPLTDKDKCNEFAQKVIESFAREPKPIHRLPTDFFDGFTPLG